MRSCRLAGQPQPPAPAVHRAQDLIAQDPQRHWPVSELAERVDVSPRHLARLFAQHAGLSIIDYQHRRAWRWRASGWSAAKVWNAPPSKRSFGLARSLRRCGKVRDLSPGECAPRVAPLTNPPGVVVTAGSELRSRSLRQARCAALRERRSVRFKAVPHKRRSTHPHRIQRLCLLSAGRRAGQFPRPAIYSHCLIAVRHNPPTAPQNHAAPAPVVVEFVQR